MKNFSQQTKNELLSLERGDSAAEGSGIFGASIPTDEASLILIPVPWEGTASYGKGTASAPLKILEASHQLDLFDLDFDKPYWAGISMLDIPVRFLAKDENDIHNVSETVNKYVYEQATKFLNSGKIVAVIGGEHSAPYSLIKALSERFDDFGILHIDAHHDLRAAFEGFTHSHASIMYNVVQNIKSVSRLVSVGVRDFCKDEYEFARKNSKINTFYDQHIYTGTHYHGYGFNGLADKIIESLPQNVYISFDIDGLKPELCPNTGTPVPGGLEFYEATTLIRSLAKSGRRIIGFDLCEVSGESDWDANVGARILYKLCGSVVHSLRILD